MKSPCDIIQVYNMSSIVSCSIWNGYGKKRTPIWVDFKFTEDMIYACNNMYSQDFKFPARVDKIMFSRRGNRRYE